MIGSIERILIMIGLIAQSWEVMVAVIALKTVARYRELDEKIEAELARWPASSGRSL